MLEKQLFLTILSRCQFFCPVHLSSVGNFIKFDFSSVFLCCFNANKNNKHVNTKTFSIGQIL